MATRTRKKAAPAPEVEEIVEDAFEELDEVDDAPEEEIEEVKPTRKQKAAKETSDDTGPTYNTQWLASHVTEQTGEATDARSLRMLLRKMAKSGELDREVGTERERYSFPKGAADPVVKAIVKKVQAGELKAAKSEGLEKVKATAAEKKAAKKTAAKKTADVEEVDEDEDLPEELETPKPKTTRKAKPSTAPVVQAKAQPSTRRRRTA